MLLMCLVGCAVPKRAVPLSVLTEVPNVRGPVRYMASFVNGGLEGENGQGPGA